MDDLEVCPLVVSPDIVDFSGMSIPEDGPQGLAVVLHVEPVPDIFSCAVNGKRLAVEGVEDHEGDELLGELAGPVVVGAVGGEHRKPVGMTVRPDEMVRGSLGCGIGGVGGVGRGLGEEAV